MTSAASDEPNDEIVERFNRDFEAAEDKAAVIEAYCAQLPNFSGFFRGNLDWHNRLNAAVSLPVESAPRLKPGDMLDDFRIVKFLTQGGMGEIYEAEQLSLQKRHVALKVIRESKIAPEFRIRFMREQAALAKLHQTNIVPVFAAGECGGLQYFAMQYIDGATLGHVVRFLKKSRNRDGTPSQTRSLKELVESAVEPVAPDAPTALPSAIEAEATAGPAAPPCLTDEYCRSVAESLATVADALDIVHRANILHRDIKPANLMAEKSGKCWVIDFGLAGLIGESASGESARKDSGDVTATGAAMGTYAYMSPEQFDGTAEPRSDVWSLGVTLYELLTLRRPFDGLKRNAAGVPLPKIEPSRAEYSRQAHDVEPVWPRQMASGVPADLDAICRKAMQKKPVDRYATARAFAADLRHWLRGEPTAANPPWTIRRAWMWAKRNPGWASVAATACALLISVTVLLLYTERLHTRAAQATADRERENVRQRDRQLELLALQREHLSPHTVGWRDRLWQKGTALAVDGPDPDLRDRMAAMLSGLDAKHDANFNEGSATFVAFDQTGQRLILGGYQGKNATDPLERNEPTRVRNLKTGDAIRSTESAIGPVGWRGDIPVQLVPPTKERPTFLLWNVDLNTPIEEFALPADHSATLEKHIEGMNIAGVVLSPDGNRVAALAHGAKNERVILVWKAGTPSPWAIIPFSAPTVKGHAEALALSEDGGLLALGTRDGRTLVWSMDAAGPKPAGEFELGRSRITSLAFGHLRYIADPVRPGAAVSSGWRLGVGDAAGTIAIWERGRRDRTMLSRESRDEVLALTFSPDGETLFSTGRAATRCWDVGTGRHLLRLLSDYNWLPGIALAPDGSRLAVTSVPRFGYNGGSDVFDLEFGRGIQTLRGLTGQVSRITITPDGRRAAGLTQNWQVGVWDVATGQLLMRVDAVLAAYSDHDDIRLTDNGSFLIIAGGTAVQRWEVPANPNAVPRLTDSWTLRPAYSNRLAITADAKILLCRNETKSGADIIAQQIDPVSDPRCVRIYELQPDSRVREIATHDDHPWAVYQILACPDGSCFIADGIKTKEKSSNSLVGYAGLTKDVLWRIPIPDSIFRGSSAIDSTGSVLNYTKEPGISLQRRLPIGAEPGLPISEGELPLLEGRIARQLDPLDAKGLRLADTGATTYFLKLSPDERVSLGEARFTPDGRFLIWGSEDGTVHVADIPAIRERLVIAGIPGW